MDLGDVKDFLDEQATKINEQESRIRILEKRNQDMEIDIETLREDNQRVVAKNCELLAELAKIKPAPAAVTDEAKSETTNA